MAWWSRLSVRGRLTFAVTVASAGALLTLSWLTMAWLREAVVNQVGVRYSAPLRRRAFRAKTISCARSGAKGGMITLPPGAKVGLVVSARSVFATLYW